MAVKIRSKTLLSILFCIIVVITALAFNARTVGAEISNDDALDTERDRQSENDSATSSQSNAVVPGSLLVSTSTGSDPNAAFEEGFIDATAQNADATTTSGNQVENRSEVLMTEDNFGNIPAFMVGEPTPSPKLLNINDDGTATIRGVIIGSDGKNLLAIKSWGGIWDIRVADDTAYTPESDGVLDMENVPVGHFIGVVGMIAWDAPYTINATYIRDWSITPSTPLVPNTGTEQNNALATTSVVQSTRTDQQLFIGTASRIGSDSFILTNGDETEYKVEVRPETIIWSDARQSIDFWDISEGDVVRVGGTISGDIIIPLVIRDTSK